MCNRYADSVDISVGIGLYFVVSISTIYFNWKLILYSYKLTCHKIQYRQKYRVFMPKIAVLAYVIYVQNMLK